jgi:hypothetical protein
MLHGSPPYGNVIAGQLQGFGASADSAGLGHEACLAASTFINAARHQVGLLGANADVVAIEAAVDHIISPHLFTGDMIGLGWASNPHILAFGLDVFRTDPVSDNVQEVARVGPSRGGEERACPEQDNTHGQNDRSICCGHLTP